MFGKLKNIFKKEKEEIPERVAKIRFSGNFRINHPLVKEIVLYRGDRFVGFQDYSDVVLEDLKSRGFKIEDETRELRLEMPVITFWEGGKIQLE